LPFIKKRRDDEVKRILAVKQSITTLEERIEKESKRRNETTTALELMFNEKMDKMKIDVETPIFAQFEVITSKAEKIKERISLLEKKVEQDEVTFPKLINERSRALLQQLCEFKARKTI
jgi:seryl-tRNA synthetase